MNRNPINSDQAANLSHFRAWVEDYRKLSPIDKVEFTELFLMQEFGVKKKKYRRDSFRKWTSQNPISEPPLEVAKWCSKELERIHSEIKALGQKTEINEPTEEVLSA